MLHIYKSQLDHTAPLKEIILPSTIKGTWFNLTHPSLDELHMVADITKCPLDFLKAALDEEERSRTEIDENCLLVITNIPVMRGTDNYDALPLGIIITSECIITVCLEKNEVLSDFDAINSKLFSTFKKTRFLFQILSKSAALYLRHLKQINHRTDEIERYLRKSMKNKEIFELRDLQKGLTYFTVALKSNGIVLEKLLRLRSNNQLHELIKIYDEDEDLLEDVITENQQAIEMVEMYSNILNGMMDTFASIISNNLNRVMKFLASMTIILAVPTMISSFFGMNVHIPLSDSEYGFSIVCATATLLTGVSAFILWKKQLF